MVLIGGTRARFALLIGRSISLVYLLISSEYILFYTQIPGLESCTGTKFLISVHKLPLIIRESFHVVLAIHRPLGGTVRNEKE